MTQTVDDVLRDLAKRGEISHISLVPSQNGKLWRASFAMCSKFGISFAEDADPARAIILACTTAKMKPRPAEKRPASIDLTAEREPEPPVDASDTNDADGPALGNPTKPPASTKDDFADLM